MGLSLLPTFDVGSVAKVPFMVNAQEKGTGQLFRKRFRYIKTWPSAIMRDRNMGVRDIVGISLLNKWNNFTWFRSLTEIET